MLDLLGDELAHPGQLVVRENVDDLQGQPLELVLFLVAELGHESADLARQRAAHLVVHVLGEQAVGLARRIRVGRDGAPHDGRDVGGEVIEYLGRRAAARAVACGQLPAHFGVGMPGVLFRPVVGGGRRPLAAAAVEDAAEKSGHGPSSLAALGAGATA